MMAGSHMRLRAQRDADDTVRRTLLENLDEADTALEDAVDRVVQSSTRLAGATKEMRRCARDRAIADATARRR